jgi:hypothetical protein
LLINNLVAAGAGLWGYVENKQLIDSKGSLKTQETANTWFSSTPQVYGFQQSSRVRRWRSLSKYGPSAQRSNPATHYPRRRPAWSTSELPNMNCTFRACGVSPYLFDLERVYR